MIVFPCLLQNKRLISIHYTVTILFTILSCYFAAMCGMINCRIQNRKKYSERKLANKSIKTNAHACCSNVKQ